MNFLINVSTVQRLGPVLGLALLPFFAGCGRQGATPDDESSLSWKRVSTDKISGVATAEVRAAIARRLEGEPPAPTPADRWRHPRAMYRALDGGPLWLGPRGLDQGRTKALLAAVDGISADAIDLSGLPLAGVQGALQVLRDSKHPTAAQLAEADVQLSALYASLGEDVLTGQVSPASLSQSWHIGTQEENVDSTLSRVLRSRQLSEAIASLAPHDDGYDALRKELARFREIVSHGGWSPVPAGKKLSPGDAESSTRLTALAERLRVEGLLSGDSHALQPAAKDRAVYDETLAGAVADFQSRHGIPVDSVLGAETVASLNVPAPYRLGQIAANLERYRWLPRSLGSRYILVNVPAFRLQAFDAGKEALEMKVIVGADYENRATPAFSDSMQYVVFRPYWDVPDSIATKEIYPKLDKDPSFLDRNNYEMVSRKGEEHIRQKPGDGNALGLIKFIFPNDFNIYLHDTPEDKLFEKDVRAFSHGCIRVERPAELASFVLGWPADSVEHRLRSDDNDHRVDLSRKLPVYIVYFTAYVKDGQLYFGNDLYDRDSAVVKALASAAAGAEEHRQMVKSLQALAG
jgi:murein L,D-transpeptidase YcbB/YkuD